MLPDGHLTLQVNEMCGFPNILELTAFDDVLWMGILSMFDVVVTVDSNDLYCEYGGFLQLYDFFWLCDDMVGFLSGVNLGGASEGFSIIGVGRYQRCNVISIDRTTDVLVRVMKVSGKYFDEKGEGYAGSVYSRLLVDRRDILLGDLQMLSDVPGAFDVILVNR
ncbi:unnamed protein product [Caenorhabditis nigoni]